MAPSNFALRAKLNIGPGGRVIFVSRGAFLKANKRDQTDTTHPDPVLDHFGAALESGSEAGYNLTVIFR